MDRTTKIIPYPVDMYLFREFIGAAFNIENVANIHNEWEPPAILARVNDQNTPYHKRFYRYFNEYIGSIYEDFIYEVVAPMFNEPIVYQKIPTIRIQFPENVGIGEKHKDSDYSHSPEEINFVLPITNMINTTAIQTDDGPINAMWGEVIIFDGANIEHWNEINKEGYTRVSLDFRVIPKSKYKPSKKTSINTKLPMEIGGYYEETS